MTILTLYIIAVFINIILSCFILYHMYKEDNGIFLTDFLLTIAWCFLSIAGTLFLVYAVVDYCIDNIENIKLFNKKK